MSRFTSDVTYKNDLKAYEEAGPARYGVSSQTAEREAMCLAEAGNTVACKICADLVFFKKLLARRPYRESFALYMRAAGLTVSDRYEWACSSKGYPLAFWSVGYCLEHYKRDSLLKDCETIDIIEAMSLEDRLRTAIELGASCLTYIDAPEAVNLVGRLLKEAADSEETYAALKGVIDAELSERGFPMIDLTVGRIACAKDCAAAAELFFKKAAHMGYAYACNNLALQEADKLIALGEDKASTDAFKAGAAAYVEYLRIAADKYESYAANRLGLFYMTGEIRGTDGVIHCRQFCDTGLARTYFTKATRYPDANAAWGYLNLIKYFQKDYDADIELMNEHMTIMRELNPKVYDIAMDL